jgi:hypothetical protein
LALRGLGRWDLGQERFQALAWLHVGLVWMLVVGMMVFPARGHTVWVPAMPLVCVVAGGAVRPNAGEMWRRWVVATLALLLAVSTAFSVAPHWHARFNALAWLSGGARSWFASPELDAGPAMPAVADHLRRAGLGDELVFVAPHSRWPPSALGLRCLLLPGNGPLLEPTYRFDVHRPPAGLHIIAASPLVGQGCLYADTHRWFREHPADVWIGETVGLWRVKNEPREVIEE